MVSLVAAAAAPFASPGTGMRFIHNHQFGAGAQKLFAAMLRFDKVQGDDDKRIDLKQRLSQAATTFQTGSRAGKHQFRVNVKLVVQLALPLFGQIGGTQHRHALNFATVEEFPCNQRRFHRFANPDIIRNQQTHGIEPKCHQQRNKLIGTWLHGNACEGTEGTRTGAKTQPHRIAQQAA